MSDRPDALIFTPAHADAAIAAALPLLKPGVTKVVIGTVDANGAQVAASFEWQTHRVDWELQAVARHDFDGANDGRITVIAQW